MSFIAYPVGIILMVSGGIGFVVVGDDKSNLEAIKKIRFLSRSKKIVPDLINSL